MAREWSMNKLQKAVRDYLTMRRGLGFKLVRHEAALREFVLFLARKRSVRITVNLALEWATQDADHQPYEWAARLSVVRGFARHWSATDPATEVPPLGLLPYRPKRAQPYFYSDHEIRTLLKAAKSRPSIDSLRPWTYHCLFGLLAVTGLRLGEALNLRPGDMDWSEGILTIRGPGSESPVWFHCILRLVRSWPTMGNAGTSALAFVPRDICW